MSAASICSGSSSRRIIRQLFFSRVTVTSQLPVRATKAGAIDFLIKPCPKVDLIAAIHAALAEDCRVRTVRFERARLRQRHSRPLLPRECEVLPLVVGGLPQQNRPPPGLASARSQCRFTAAT